MAGGRKKSGPKAAYMRFGDNHMSPNGHVGPLELARDFQTHGGLERSGLDLVLCLWENVCDHTLTGTRSAAFRQHPDALNLATCTPLLLGNSAAEAMDNNPDGHLLLTEWWQTALDRAERAKR